MNNNPKNFSAGRDQGRANSRTFPLRPFAFSPFPPSLTVPSVDALIVLGASLNPRDEPGRVARARLVHALNLWRHCGCLAYVLVTGGVAPGRGCSEARAMADWALNWAAENWGEEARVALRACLVLEEVSGSTAASARHTLPLAQELGSRAVGLVSDSLHMRRAHLLFRRQFVPRGIMVHPLPARGLMRHYWQQRRYLWLGKMALREGGAWLKVLGQGLLNPRHK
jgi:uncharacterized SAM-binding protein YcdF (DUF218 family)